MIKIEHGVYKDHLVENKYHYATVSVKATLKDYQSLLEVVDTSEVISFTALPGETPEIGDFIVNGQLVKKVEPQVNNDWSRWKDKDL